MGAIPSILHAPRSWVGLTYTMTLRITYINTADVVGGGGGGCIRFRAVLPSFQRRPWRMLVRARGRERLVGIMDSPICFTTHTIQNINQIHVPGGHDVTWVVGWKPDYI